LSRGLFTRDYDTEATVEFDRLRVKVSGLSVVLEFHGYLY
jgi:hypothetical protein